MATDAPITAAVDANGNAVCNLQQVNAALLWEVRQVALYTRQQAVAGTVSIWKNGVLWAPSAALTPIPNILNLAGAGGSGITASGLPYMVLRSGDTAQAVFQGCIPGDVATANFIYEEFLVSEYGVNIAGG